MYELTIEREFSAAHRMSGYPGPCARLHGHNYRVRIAVAGDQLDDRGMLIDFSELKALCDGIIEGLDHQNLNELPPFADRNPSSENLARYLYESIRAQLPGSVQIKEVKVFESANSSVTYRER